MNKLKINQHTHRHPAVSESLSTRLEGRNERNHLFSQRQCIEDIWILNTAARCAGSFPLGRRFNVFSMTQDQFQFSTYENKSAI